jgi:hypothetical protein
LKSGIFGRSFMTLRWAFRQGTADAFTNKAANRRFDCGSALRMLADRVVQYSRGSTRVSQSRTTRRVPDWRQGGEGEHKMVCTARFFRGSAGITPCLSEDQRVPDE